MLDDLRRAHVSERVLPDDLYESVMNGKQNLAKGSVFQEIVNRFGDPAAYEPAKMRTGGMQM